ncbi:hypothetical protein Bca52824_027451 [Brassica carinata]|uniref:Uncharacterized protein n=1 Tax=Brassica carinata TaxID=52824 RepID=A0A8X8AN58_BRACI|nr:hypothetical protein Bca52824_027451 [Brassica carinata]
MDSEWWDDREKEIQYAKKIRENGIPHMELMRRICGRQGNTEQNERHDKSVPETQDNDGDHTTDVHHHPQTISIDSPPRSPIGPSKRSNRKQTRAAPYETSRGKDVALSREKNIPRKRKSFEKEINEQFKEMMELRRSQVAEAKERREKNEAQPFKEAYEVLKSIQGLTRWTDFERFKALQRCHGDPSSANPEQNIIRTTMESHNKFDVPSRSELMSLFEEVGYKRGYGKMGDGGGGKI